MLVAVVAALFAVGALREKVDAMLFENVTILSSERSPFRFQVDLGGFGIRVARCGLSVAADGFVLVVFDVRFQAFALRQFDSAAHALLALLIFTKLVPDDTGVYVAQLETCRRYLLICFVSRV